MSFTTSTPHTRPARGGGLVSFDQSVASLDDWNTTVLIQSSLLDTGDADQPRDSLTNVFSALPFLIEEDRIYGSLEELTEQPRQSIACRWGIGTRSVYRFSGGP